MNHTLPRPHSALLAGLFAAAALFCSAASAGGNAELMQNAKQRAFQLNEQVLQKLDAVDSDATSLAFTGRAVRGPDGKLTISIDEVNSVPSNRSPAPSGDIRYITFEEMLEGQKQAVTTAPPAAPPSKPKMRFGGGAASLSE